MVTACWESVAANNLDTRTLMFGMASSNDTGFVADQVGTAQLTCAMVRGTTVSFVAAPSETLKLRL